MTPVLCCEQYYEFYVLCLGAEEAFERVVFLYHLERGRAGASYGLNVAALAGLPHSILQLAHEKSKQLEKEVSNRLSAESNVLQTLKHILSPFSQPISQHLIIL